MKTELELPAMRERSKAKTQIFTLGKFRNEPLSLVLELAIDTCTMVKKRLLSSDTVFQFETPGNPRKAHTEAQHSSTDSPGSVFLRWVHPVCLTDGFCYLTGSP